MKHISLISFILLYQTTQGQDDVPKFKFIEGDTVYTVVDVQAQPANGMKQFYKKTSSSLKYPAEAKRLAIEGNVFIEFLVDEKGALSNFRIVKGIGGGCDEEALRVLENRENWIPARVNGKSVKSKFNIVIIFKR